MCVYVAHILLNPQRGKCSACVAKKKCVLKKKSRDGTFTALLRHMTAHDGT